MNIAYWSTMDTPVGPFTTVAATDGAVLASGWTHDLTSVTDRIAPSLRPSALHRRDDLGAISEAVRDYYAGDLHAVDAIAVRQHSGEFLRHAWQILRTVPPGEPVTYTDYAARAGRPAAVRAAASACARNAAALFVPCHRVLRADGSLGGFRWGLEIKRWLLEYEGRA